jgi:hypothetical protein
VGNVRVILAESDQTPTSGFWVYGGTRPDIGQVILVESTLAADIHLAQISQIISGQPYLIFATKVEN